MLSRLPLEDRSSAAILMTTDPGDLVFDPTCGSGTTAYVAEQWGQALDHLRHLPRCAVTLAQQRLMTANVRLLRAGLSRRRGGISGFRYKIVPHVTLRSIAKNPDIKEGYVPS